jgi:hydrogenase nickel incorporation protein HypB
MCAHCGCGADRPHHHDGSEDHHHHPHHHHLLERPRRTITLEQEILAKNDRAAALNREVLAARAICALNLTSAPGAGKTTLLEALLGRLRGHLPLAVIEGDQETARDAERIRATGTPAVQINTGTGCHLDAEMVARALDELAPPPGALLFIENVGNLVCPALFDLGERAKVVLMSVTEGEDKPLKYPHMFRAAEVMVLTKIDLLPHLQFDVARCLQNARRINPGLRLFQVSATRGDGLEAFCDWAQGAARAAA